MCSTCIWRVSGTGDRIDAETACGHFVTLQSLSDADDFCPWCGISVEMVASGGGLLPASCPRDEPTDVLSKSQLASKFGDFIRNVRARNRMSKTEFGVHIGVSAAAILSYERGESLPTVPDLIRISCTLGVPVNDIFGLTPGGDPI